MAGGTPNTEVWLDPVPAAAKTDPPELPNRDDVVVVVLEPKGDDA